MSFESSWRELISPGAAVAEPSTERRRWANLGQTAELKPGAHLWFSLRFYFVFVTSADRFPNVFSAGFKRLKDKCRTERAGILR